MTRKTYLRYVPVSCGATSGEWRLASLKLVAGGGKEVGEGGETVLCLPNKHGRKSGPTRKQRAKSASSARTCSKASLGNAREYMLCQFC